MNPPEAHGSLRLLARRRNSRLAPWLKHSRDSPFTTVRVHLSPATRVVSPEIRATSGPPVYSEVAMVNDRVSMSIWPDAGGTVSWMSMYVGADRFLGVRKKAYLSW